jgi:hypothetical protein
VKSACAKPLNSEEGFSNLCGLVESSPFSPGVVPSETRLVMRKGAVIPAVHTLYYYDKRFFK